MLKQTVTYRDFDDVERTDTFYFNLTRTDMVDLMDIQPRLEEWSKKTAGDPRELTVSEVRDMLDIIKRLIQSSYGVRSEDGKKHRKSPEIFADFKDSAAYDAFIFSLFEDTQKAIDFMIGIIPKGVVTEESMAEARALASAPVQEVPIPDNVTDLNSGQLDATEETVPAWLREGRDPTQKELAAMSPAELQLAFRHKTQKQQGNA